MPRPRRLDVRRCAVVVGAAVALALAITQPATGQPAPTPPAPTPTAPTPPAPTPTAPTTPAPATPAGTPAEQLARLATLDAATLALSDEISAAQSELTVRRSRLAAANSAAGQAASSSFAAQVTAGAARIKVDDLVRASYSGARTSRLSALLVSQSPQELLDRMTVLDLVGSDSARALAAATAAAAAATDADTMARGAQRVAADAEAEAVRVQAALVQRRGELQAQTVEANALLAALTARAAADAAAAAKPTIGAAALASSKQASAVRSSRASATRSSLFVAPVEGIVTSPFGVRDGSMHRGVDIANKIGTPIVAIADGVVIDSGPAAGFGLWVRIRHDDGTITVYGHNDRNTVTVGQQVSAGEQIAAVGNRGESTGPHVHVEVLPPGGQNVDPIAWLRLRGVAI